MNLYLMRHGLAVERGTPGYDNDRERPLTPKGERKVRRVAEALVRMEITFDAIFSSPLLRAQQTAETVAREMKLKVQLTEHLSPGGHGKELVKILQQAQGNGSAQEFLLVGHSPDLGQFASQLLTGGNDLTLKFKKAGIAKLAVDVLGLGRCAQLEWLMSYQQLQLMT